MTSLAGMVSSDACVSLVAVASSPGPCNAEKQNGRGDEAKLYVVVLLLLYAFSMHMIKWVELVWDRHKKF